MKQDVAHPLNEERCGAVRGAAGEVGHLHGETGGYVLRKINLQGNGKGRHDHLHAVNADGKKMYFFAKECFD